MAEHDFQERTEHATPKRREEARKQGRVPRSRELNTMLVTVSGAALLYMLGSWMYVRLAEIMRSGLSLERAAVFDSNASVMLLIDIFKQSALLLAPLLFALLAVVLFVPQFMGGWIFNLEMVAPKLDKLNPLSGLKRIFALRSLIELVKSLAKFAFVSVTAAGLLWWHADSLLSLGGQSLAS
ncbi:MAG: EscU/YscU/HrcU family type III secretion system export apparatus switch protein, partial [Gammaproteobacteria bacterium]|nr:EscU/YscU/HrcU family type III secretion system export apparatus switch protein [Gammaproteobacteria bacterium]